MDYNTYFTYYPSNYNKLFNDKIFITALINEVKKKLGRHIQRTEKMAIINILKNVNPVIFKGSNYKNIIDSLTSTIAEEIVKFKCGNENENDVNIHEMLKSEMGVINTSDFSNDPGIFTEQVVSTFSTQVEVTSLLGNKTFTDLQKIINPNLVKKNVYILLDTRYRTLDNDGTNFFKWNFMNTETVSQGTVNAVGNIKDITGFRVYPVRIPYNPLGDTDYDRITLFIQEFSSQSFIAQENRRFHFIFSSTIEDRWMDLEPQRFNDGYFRFRTPISRLDSLTISFGAPLEPIIFDPDRMLSTVSDYNKLVNNIRYTEFTTLFKHNLETGDRVYISNFTTANPNTDNPIVSLINRSVGHTATIITDTKFIIKIDSSSIRFLGPGTINVTNGSPIIIGVGTNFGVTVNVNDVIEISGMLFSILSIQSQTQLTLSTVIPVPTSIGLSYYKNNILNDIRPTVYFGSKRIFVALEIEFFDSGV